MTRQQGNKGKGKPARNQKDSVGKKPFVKRNAPFKKKAAPKKPSNPDEIRLNKYIANSGICSRREADENISIGLVTVNGKVITEMGYKVKLGDEVKFDGRRINPEPKVYVLLNKPKGFATTTAEGKGRTVMDLVANATNARIKPIGAEGKGRTVMDLVANATNARIKPIGRLGRNSLGLLLFTNDDEVVQKFTNSKNGVGRLFQIELDKNLKFEDLKQIQEGFKVQGKLVSVEEISYIDGESKNKIGIKIKNTGNTILRTIFDHFNYDILKIDCVAIAHLTKKDIPRGHWKHLTLQEINTLKMI